jgi:DNA-binding IclR family transcriptional regulator
MSKTPPRAAKAEDPYIVPALVRGLEVLQAFTEARPSLTLGDLAAATGVTRSAVFRIAYTLSRLAFLVHDQRTHTYTIGPAVLRLGQGYHVPRAFVEVALPHLEALRDRTGWSAHLGMLEGTEVVYLLRVPAQRGLTSIVHLGSRLPAHATAMGRVLLAQLDRAAMTERYRDASLVGTGARTPRSLPALLEQARRDAARGHVVQVGDFEQGVASVAAPIRDTSGQIVAAINIAGTVTGASETSAESPFVQGVLASAATISRELGFRDSQ